MGGLVDVLSKSCVSQSRRVFWSGVTAALMSTVVIAEPSSVLTEPQAAFLAGELNRVDELPEETSRDEKLLQVILDRNARLSESVVWRLMAANKHAEDSWSRIDHVVVQTLLDESESRRYQPVEQSQLSATLIAQSARHLLIDQILTADQALQSDALKALDRLSAYYQIQLYSSLVSQNRANEKIDYAKVRKDFLAERSVEDLSLSALIAKRILDRNPSDTEIRSELISLLDETNKPALADDHRLTLALLQPEQSIENFRVVKGLERPRKVVPEAASEPVVGQVADALSREDFDTQLDYLAEQIFNDPTNLNLNLKYFKEQVALGDLEGAEVTLERILLVDPESKFAKILMAETQIKLGKLPEARNILNKLLAVEGLAPEMRDKAISYVSQIEDVLNPITWRHSVGLTAGISNNALGRTATGTVLFQDLSLPSGQSDVDISFNELSFDSSMSYRMPYETPTIITVTGFGSGRESDHEDLSRTSTVGGSASIKEIDDGTIIDSSISAIQTRVDGQPYANFASLAASLMTGLTENLVVGSNVAYSKNMYQEFEGVTNNTNNSSETVVIGLLLVGQVKQVGWSVTGKWSDTNAKDRSVSNDLESLAMALNYKFDNCSNTLSADRSWVQAKAANTFVSTKPKRVTQTNWAYGGACTVENFWQGVALEPSFRFVWRDADSNIPNYAKESSEYSLGVKLRF